MAKLADFAAKARRDPYKLELEDGTVISIEHPTITQWEESGDRDIADFLTSLGVAAEEAQKVRDLTRDAPIGTETALITDMADYFRLGKQQAS